MLHLAYSDYIEPPERVRPLDNVVVQITLNCECHYDPAYKEDQWRLIRAWSHVTPNLMLYEYFNHTWKLQLPRAIPRAVGAAIPYYRQCGARFFSAQASDDFGNEGLTLYLAAKLLWDSSLDVDELVADYCEHAFAEGAALGRRYFARLEALWDAAIAELGPRWGGNPHVYLTMLTPETIAELKGYLTEGPPAGAVRGSARAHPVLPRRMAVLRGRGGRLPPPPGPGRARHHHLPGRRAVVAWHGVGPDRTRYAGGGSAAPHRRDDPRLGRARSGSGAARRSVYH